MTQPNPIRQRQLNTPRRRSPLLGIGLTALIAAGAVAGATAIFSGRAQDTTQNFVSQLSSSVNSSGVATLKQTGYQKGFADSTQTMLLDLSDKESVAKGEKPVRLLVTNHIKHGPFPGLQGVGQAIIDTDFKFEDPEMQKQFDQLFPNQKPRIHTLVGLGGNTTSDVQVPGGNFTDPKDGTVMNWKALAGTVKMAGEQVNTDMSWPGLSVVDKGADPVNMDLSGLKLVGSSRPTTPGAKLSVGNFKMTLDKMNIVSEGEPMSISGLNIMADTKLTSPEAYQALVQYDMGSVKFQDKELKNLQVHLGLHNLSRAPLERIITLVNEMQAKRPAGSTEMPDMTPAQQELFQKDLMALLKGNPKLTLDRLSLTQPSGDIVFNGELSLPKLATASEEELGMMAAVPQMAMMMADLHLEGKANQKALEELTAMGGGKTASLGDSIQTMVDSGYVTKQGNDLSVKLDMKDGRMTVNGKPLQ